MNLIDWFRNLMDVTTLLPSLGPWVLEGLAIIVFIESGLLFPFLPGDSLLVGATILRETLGISVWQILLVASIAAMAGDQVGFWLGRRFGRRLFRPDARVLRTDRLESAEAFFDRHGPIALVLARFVPIVRTYVPLAAGTAGMPLRRFMIWNIPSGFVWVTSMTLVGLLLGQVPGVAHSIEAISIIIIGVSVLPLVIKGLVSRRASAASDRPPTL